MVCPALKKPPSTLVNIAWNSKRSEENWRKRRKKKKNDEKWWKMMKNDEKEFECLPSRILNFDPRTWPPVCFWWWRRARREWWWGPWHAQLPLKREITFLHEFCTDFARILHDFEWKNVTFWLPMEQFQVSPGPNLFIFVVQSSGLKNHTNWRKLEKYSRSHFSSFFIIFHHFSSFFFFFLLFLLFHQFSSLLLLFQAEFTKVLGGFF